MNLLSHKCVSIRSAVHEAAFYLPARVLNNCNPIIPCWIRCLERLTGSVFKNVRYVPDSTCAVMREGQHGQRVMDSVGSATSYSCGG